MEVFSVSPPGCNPCPALYLRAALGTLVQSVPVSPPVSSLCCFSFCWLGLSNLGLKFQAKRRKCRTEQWKSLSRDVVDAKNIKELCFFLKKKGLDNSWGRAIVTAIKYDDPRKAD